MASETEYTVKLKTDTSALKKMQEQIRREAKETQTNLAKKMKLEGRYNQKRRRELEHEMRLAKGREKDALKHEQDLARVKTRQRSEEWAHNRKVWREQKRTRDETTRWRKQEERIAKHGGVGRQAWTGAKIGVGIGASIGGGLLGMFVGGAQSAYGKYVETAKASQAVMGLSASGRFNENLIPKAKLYDLQV